MVSTLFSGARGAPARARAAAPEHNLDLFSPLVLPADQWEIVDAATAKEDDPLAFPLPPTLEDIRRMEPELSPYSMQVRAWDYRQERLAPPPVPAKTPAPVRPDSTQGLPAGEVFGLYQSKGFTEQDSKAVVKAKAAIIGDFVTTCMLRVAQSCASTQAPTRLSTAAGASIQGRLSMILVATSLSSSVPFLAIWYARRLAMEVRQAGESGPAQQFADLLLAGGPVSLDELAIRLFVTGLMMSDAWLDDHSFAVKTWRDLTGMPSKTLHSIQIEALKVLGYRLRPQVQEWAEHVQELEKAIDVFKLSRPGKDTVVVTLVLREVMAASSLSRTSQAPRVQSPPPASVQQNRVTFSAKSLRSPQQHPVAVPVIRTPVALPASTSHKRKLPPPADWSPEADPIILKSRRTASAAIGAERARGRAPTQSHWVHLMPRSSSPYPSISHLRTLSGATPHKTEGARSTDVALPWMRGFAQRQSY